MISRPWLGAVTHIAGCPEREIDITAARTCPIIFPAATISPGTLGSRRIPVIKLRHDGEQ
uniref:Uncharacterized protein n=1 Tax=Medicago truncatula TaxID=3880 RepID=I3SHG2_MEDTR|nr:unknown [Medicago truncatula]